METIDVRDWPGFAQTDEDDLEKYAERIAFIREGRASEEEEGNIQKKARPEAEALLVVKNERGGEYCMISDAKSPSWFISNTSILNVVDNGSRVTWQPEAFLRFASTLSPALEPEIEAEQEFDRILLGLAASGLNLLDEKTIQVVFGGVIDQALLEIDELRREYEEVLEAKYGEPIDAVLRRVPRSDQLLAVTQLKDEIIQRQAAAHDDMKGALQKTASELKKAKGKERYYRQELRKAQEQKNGAKKKRRKRR